MKSNPFVGLLQGIPTRHEENESPDFGMSDKKNKEPANAADFQVFLQWVLSSLCSISWARSLRPAGKSQSPALCCTGNSRQESCWVQMLLKAPKNSLSLHSWRCSHSQGGAGHQGAQGAAQTPKTRGLAVRIGQIKQGFSSISHSLVFETD